MARVTVEDCLQKVDNRFTLVHLAAKRVQQLRDGAPPYMAVKNKEVVVALREVAAGNVYPVTSKEAEMERLAAEDLERERLAAAREAAPEPAPVLDIEDADEADEVDEEDIVDEEV